MGLLIGNFETNENAYLRNSMVIHDRNEEANLFSEVRGNTSLAMDEEIEMLKQRIESLEKAVKNVKENIQSEISERYYFEWLKLVNGLSSKFKQKYSNECNCLYDHYYRMHKYYGKEWSNINQCIGRFSKSILSFNENQDKDQSKDIWDFEGFEENDLARKIVIIEYIRLLIDRACKPTVYLSRLVFSF